MKKPSESIHLIKVVAISAIFLTVQSLRADKITLNSNAVGSEFDSFEKELSLQGKILAAADDLELVGRFSTTAANLKTIECNNLNIIEAENSLKGNGAFYNGNVALKVNGILTILGSTLTKNRGTLQFNDLVLGSLSRLDIFVNELATWGNSINCAANSRLRFTLFNDRAVTNLQSPDYSGMRLKGTASFVDGAYVVLSFLQVSTPSLITPGKYLLVKSSHIVGMPKLIVTTKNVIVENGRFSLEVGDGNLWLVVAP